ncbi:Gp49 family protein [Burkholderia cepacia]|uniref:Gp49 family protein n=1 Tax=Burkholderia cepacia TaxID=292 RepID=UPI002FE130A5
MNMATQPAARGDDETIEQEIQRKGKTAPRLTTDDIQAAIFSEHYFTAEHGIEGAMARLQLHQVYIEVDTDAGERCPAHNPLGLLTFCVLVLRNGFTVTGESACVSPENFDAEIGRKVARQNAVAKIWPLEGYLLKQRLHEEENPAAAPESPYAPHQQCVIDEKDELDERLLKLNGFFGTSIFTGLADEERERLAAQERVMAEYSAILGDRIAAF